MFFLIVLACIDTVISASVTLEEEILENPESAGTSEVLAASMSEKLEKYLYNSYAD